MKKSNTTAGSKISVSQLARGVPRKPVHQPGSEFSSIASGIKKESAKQRATKNKFNALMQTYKRENSPVKKK